MRWLIPSERYKDLLEKREKYIGRNFTESLSTLVSGAAMIIGAVLSDYSSLSGALRLTVMFANYALALGLTIGGVIMTILAAHDRYTAKRLYEETADLNEIEHRYSIVAVKDTFQKYPSRFLLYYDKRWRCNFFFSFPTAETDEKDILDISTRLSGALQIPAQQIQLEKRGFDLSRKYSVSHEENRTYAHTF